VIESIFKLEMAPSSSFIGKFPASISALNKSKFSRSSPAQLTSFPATAAPPLLFLSFTFFTFVGFGGLGAFGAFDGLGAFDGFGGLPSY